MENIRNFDDNYFNLDNFDEEKIRKAREESLKGKKEERLRQKEKINITRLNALIASGLIILSAFATNEIKNIKQSSDTQKIISEISSEASSIFESGIKRTYNNENYWYDVGSMADDIASKSDEEIDELIYFMCVRFKYNVVDNMDELLSKISNKVSSESKFKNIFSFKSYLSTLGYDISKLDEALENYKSDAFKYIVSKEQEKKLEEQRGFGK